MADQFSGDVEEQKTWKETLETQYSRAFDKKEVGEGKEVLVLPIESDDGKHGTLDMKALGDYLIIAGGKILSIAEQGFDIEKVDFNKFEQNLAGGRFTESKPRVADKDRKIIHFSNNIYKDGLTDPQNFVFVEMNPSDQRTWKAIEFQASERQKVNSEKLNA